MSPAAIKIITNSQKNNVDKAIVITEPASIARTLGRIGYKVKPEKNKITGFVKRMAKQTMYPPAHIALVLHAFSAGIENADKPVCGVSPCCGSCQLSPACSYFQWGDFDNDNHKITQKLNIKDFDGLTENEILQDLLSGKMDARDIKAMLMNFNNINKIFAASRKELLAQPGMTQEAVYTILLTSAIVHKSRALPIMQGHQVSSSNDVAEYFKTLRDYSTEVLYVLLLNSNNRVIKPVKVAEGGSNAVSVNIADIMRSAVSTDKATGIILIHNHPSGAATPSKDDFILTNAVNEACEILGIRLIDHIIIAGNEFSRVK